MSVKLSYIAHSRDRLQVVVEIGGRSKMLIGKPADVQTYAAFQRFVLGLTGELFRDRRIEKLTGQSQQSAWLDCIEEALAANWGHV